MNINSEIKKLLREHNIDYTKGMLVLLSLYFELPTDTELDNILHDTMTQINVIKIVDKNLNNGTIVWNVPLFEEDKKKQSEWQWVLDEYRPLFTSVARDRGGSPSGCIKRMKAFFASHPEVRKEDVLEAARAYIRATSNPKYLQSADYFIVKGKGADTTSRLEQYLEIIMENRKKNSQPKMMGK